MHIKKRTLDEIIGHMVSEGAGLTLPPGNYS